VNVSAGTGYVYNYYSNLYKLNFLQWNSVILPKLKAPFHNADN